MSDSFDNRPLSAATKACLLLRLLVRPALARKLGTLVTEGYLARTGWVRSVVADKIVDSRGRAQPWFAQPFTDFLDRRLNLDWTVFEYGSGASTQYFAARVAMVISVDHDEGFANTLRPSLPANARLIFCREESSSYVNAVENCDSPPEIVVVDGVDRVRCVAAAVPRLAPTGVLILDDSERIEYAEAKERLTKAGFRELDFWGLAPGRVERKCTSVFYRDANVLGL